MLIMWIGATGVVYVVFLNMLIAIMAQTFKDVFGNTEGNGLQEQVILMSDHLWLVKTAALFSDARYIMRVAPSNKKPTDSELCEVAVEDFGDRIGAKLTQSGSEVEQGIQFVDQNTRFLLG
jgi:hypothetical protein